MADVVFVTPDLDGHVTKAPVGTLLLATILNRSGIDTKILPFYHFGDIQKFDLFIENDPHYALLKEISRFLRWRRDPDAPKRDVFGFDVKALLDGADIPAIRPALTMVSATTGPDGKRKIFLNTRP